ncbi:MULTISPECIES: hypothetical protein [unclassified Microcoleus]|jgi:uncharacterized protein|uniref:hypothetical protein n=1 Tax=unclassified Microcoleus TaxID=2642155 RepID=UPI001DB46EED|nr:MULTISPECIES: hypothetical protein [unclassified Microcoleus]MCC3442292.1 hypothetical protein [Microcoleus sp. PH2017_03_ELD_O_A]MCC3507227.1 hypothetical protein [Microcoleus sp. PH2017_19_SFW_U_A]MCC3473892.1 hypothetical protein [Microcoleus sp. PH2017_13_LAR_U_A]MCC3486368.1 hypothetical protein [Microcoleus sp. PH2017_14_LAR_D_A]MCC3498525.1 hypothetical protein [Microcoleus sp. PH2017_15_JOR_U_A]
MKEHSAPAVVAIARRVKPGYEADFEAAVRGVTLAASTFPGYLARAAGASRHNL